MKKPPRLSLVNPAEPAVIPPTRPLGQAGMRFWRDVMSTYAIDDSGGLEILLQACAAIDKAEELADAVARDGAIVMTRNGPKEHPALRAELGFRSFAVRSIHRLGLDVEPLGRIGRPAGF